MDANIKILHIISSYKETPDEKHVKDLGGDKILLSLKQLNEEILNNYDVVICSGGGTSIDNEVAGNILFEYIKNGGKCISIRASNQIRTSNQNLVSNDGYFLKGRFPHAIEPGAGPFFNKYRQKEDCHIIMKNIKSFKTHFSIASENITEGSKIIAYWNDGCILGAEKNVGKGTIISFSFGYHCVSDEEIQILKNAIFYLLCNEWNINNHKLFPYQFRHTVFILLLIFKVLKKNKILNVSKDMVKYIIVMLNRLNRSINRLY